MNARPRWLFPALALLLTLSGCGRSGLVRVTGKLTHKGQPVPSTLVTFQPEDGSRPSRAVTADDGSFSLRFSRQEEGVSRGRHTVVLRYSPSGPEELGQAPPKAPKELQAVIAKYGDLKTSNLHYEITRGGQFIEIDLP
jgi:hypothetical protein